MVQSEKFKVKVTLC